MWGKTGGLICRHEKLGMLHGWADQLMSSSRAGAYREYQGWDQGGPKNFGTVGEYEVASADFPTTWGPKTPCSMITADDGRFGV